MIKFFDLLSSIIGVINRSIAIIGITTGVALAFINVVARYAFNYSLPWASELTVYLFLWGMFLVQRIVLKLMGIFQLVCWLKMFQNVGPKP